jgi:hypothetical protein
VAVALPDAAIFVVNSQFRTLVLAHLSPGINGVLFVVMMAGGAIGTAPLDIPTSGWIWHNVVGFWSFFG